MGAPISILVTSPYDEDRSRILAALSDQKDFSIAGVEKDEVSAIIRSEQIKPDVLVLDSKLPGTIGLKIAPIVHRRSPLTAIVFICDNEEESYAVQALKAGISGFLLKKADIDKLALIVRIVHNGGYYVSASITAKAINTFILGRNNDRQFKECDSSSKNDVSFSVAERGIITCIAKGYSDNEIAKHLNYSTGTIKNCVTAIKHKTKLKNRLQIVIFSLVNGFISLEHLDNFLMS